MTQPMWQNLYAFRKISIQPGQLRIKNVSLCPPFHESPDMKLTVCAFRNDGLGGVFTGMSFVYCDSMRSIRYSNHRDPEFSLITPGWLVVFWCVVFLGATC